MCRLLADWWTCIFLLLLAHGGRGIPLVPETANLCAATELQLNATGGSGILYYCPVFVVFVLLMTFNKHRFLPLQS